ncbi:MAG TPA: methyltransferase domain-containing protein [Gaiellaceae bacterium]|nr:methyltransferase domain-containing protein [Gaiellaceae bacterium]
MIEALDVMRCPVCRGRLAEDDGLRCQGCAAHFEVEDGIPRMLDDRLPGIASKRGEIEGWVAMAKAQGWYEPDDEIDARLPFLCRDCGWDDRTWRANEHSFSLLLDRYVRPGMRVLEVGAAKAWAAQHLVPRGVEYVATDILADAQIGIGRGAFYAERVGPFARVQADGEHLPFADGAFDLVYCVAALHHALDLRRMVSELARVTRRGGVVAALNEGTRAVRASGEVDDQAEEKQYGINEHVHTLYAYLWAFLRSGLVVTRVEHAEGDADLARRRIGGKLRRVPFVGRQAATWFAQTCYGYSGVSLFARKVA